MGKALVPSGDGGDSGFSEVEKLKFVYVGRYNELIPIARIATWRCKIHQASFLRGFMDDLSGDN